MNMYTTLNREIEQADNLNKGQVVSAFDGMEWKQDV